MSKSPYEQFPCIVTHDIIIRKMVDSDLDSLFEICSDENVYEYTPTFLYTRSKQFLKTAIQHLGGRDYEKKKWIISGISVSTSILSKEAK